MFESEYSLYYSNFPSIVWENGSEDPEKCICKGRGWVLSEIDTYHECRYHKGEHPEDYSNECPEDFGGQKVSEISGWISTPFEDDDIPF